MDFYKNRMDFYKNRMDFYKNRRNKQRSWAKTTIIVLAQLWFFYVYICVYVKKRRASFFIFF
mgnify:CR=1 FL=1